MLRQRPRILAAAGGGAADAGFRAGREQQRRARELPAAGERVSLPRDQHRGQRLRHVHLVRTAPTDVHFTLLTSVRVPVPVQVHTPVSGSCNDVHAFAGLA